MQGECKLCGKWGTVERHHLIFGNGYRKLAEKYKLVCYLCSDCHHNKVHKIKRFMDWSRQLGQQMFEKEYGHEEFMRVFGKNWL